MKDDPKIKVWVTKYAFTKGILVYGDAEHCLSISDKMISVRRNEFTTCHHKPDWHTSEEEAVAAVEKMRQKKIAGLKKQITKLEKMEVKIFEVPEDV
jgi:hypothetical protein